MGGFVAAMFLQPVQLKQQQRSAFAELRRSPLFDFNKQRRGRRRAVVPVSSLDILLLFEIESFSFFLSFFQSFSILESRIEGLSNGD